MRLWLGLRPSGVFSAGNGPAMRSAIIGVYFASDVSARHAHVEGSDREDIRNLGAGPVFASARVEGVDEITWSEAKTLPAGQMAQVLLFDWWMQNEDRSLSSLGGNPNLLMGTENAGARRLWEFDFNLAFDEHFNTARFWQNHLFAELLPVWPEALRARAEIALLE